MTGAHRFAKYAAKMTEANQDQWSLKIKEKRANYLARVSEQQKDAVRKRDKEGKKAQRGAAKNIKPVDRLEICQKIYTTKLLDERILHTENA